MAFSRIRRMTWTTLVLCLALFGLSAKASRLYKIQFVSGDEAVVYLSREGELQPGDLLYVIRHNQRVGEGQVLAVNGLQANIHLAKLSVTPSSAQDSLVMPGGYAKRPSSPGATVGYQILEGDPIAAEEDLTDPLEELYFGSEGEVVAIATLSPRRELTSPSTVSVLRREDLGRMANKRLGELFEDLPGFNTMRLSRSNQEISIRGFNREFSNKILVLLDGQPLHREYFGNTFWETIPVGVEDLDRVEVIRGPGSALYGENAFLGVVNFITRKTREEGKNHYIKPAMDEGNFTLAGGTTVNLPMSGRKLLISASGERLSSFGTEGSNAFGPSNTTLDVSQGVQKVFVRTSEGGPWQMAIGMTRNRKRNFSAGVADKSNQEADLFNVSYDNGDFSARFGLDRFEETSDGNPVSVLALPTNQIVQERRQTFEALVKRKRWGASEWTLGVQMKDSHASGGFLPKAQDRTTISGVASGDLVVGPLVATLGLRYDNNDFESRISPRLSLVRELKGGRSFRLSYGSAFRSPTFYELGYFNQPPPIQLALEDIDLGGQIIPPGIDSGELVYTIQGNPALKSERIQSLELGYRVQKDRSSLGLTLFHNRIDNLVLPQEESVPTCPGGYCGIHPTDPTKLLFVGNATFKNVGEATSAGLELDYRYEFNDSLTLLYNLSRQIPKQANFGGDVPFSPRTLSSLGLQYRLDDTSQLRATLRQQGSFNSLLALNTSPRKESGRTILDLGLSKAMSDGQNRLEIDILNAFNKKYSDSPNYELMGRIFRGSMTIYY